MNYKRIGVVLIASASIILAGCGNSAKNMTFQETYNAFLDSHTNQVLDLLNGLSTAPALGDESTYAISGNMMSGAQIHLMI